MTRKRDFIEEIHDRRSRAGAPIAVDRLFERLRKLLAALDDSASVGDEFLRYFPIAMVAFLETYTRTIVQELVDSGPPFSDRITALSDRPIELETMKAIQGHRITLGELLGHMTHVSNLADMKRSLDPLLDAKILDIVKTAAGDDIGPLINGLESTFRLRHIYAHEFPSDGRVDRGWIGESVRAAASFLTILDRGIFGIAFTQSAMNRHTGNRLEELEQELDELAASLAGSLGEPYAKRLHDAQEAWRNARDHTAHLMADLEAEGGSMRPMVYSRFAAELTRHRLEELRNLKQFKW